MDKRPPFVVHCMHDIEQFPDTLYIGRLHGRGKKGRSKWHNPFKITADTDRAEAIELFRLHMTVGEGRFLDLNELTGKPLGCWCRRFDEPRTDDNMCHGDVLVDLWEVKINGKG